jgi:hypothetical protein
MKKRWAKRISTNADAASAQANRSSGESGRMKNAARNSTAPAARNASGRRSARKASPAAAMVTIAQRPQRARPRSASRLDAVASHHPMAR